MRCFTSAAEAFGAGAAIHVDEVCVLLGADGRSARRRSARGSSRGLGRRDHVVNRHGELGERQLETRPVRAPCDLNQATAALDGFAHARFDALGEVFPREARRAGRPVSGPTALRRIVLGTVEAGGVARGSWPGHDVEEEGEVGGAAREGPGLVERGGERDEAVARDQAVGRPQPATSPLKAAGWRVEPPVSVPVAAGATKRSPRSIPAPARPTRAPACARPLRWMIGLWPARA